MENKKTQQKHKKTQYEDLRKVNPNKKNNDKNKANSKKTNKNITSNNNTNNKKPNNNRNLNTNKPKTTKINKPKNIKKETIKKEVKPVAKEVKPVASVVTKENIPSEKEVKQVKKFVQKSVKLDALKNDIGDTSVFPVITEKTIKEFDAKKSEREEKIKLEDNSVKKYSHKQAHIHAYDDERTQVMKPIKEDSVKVFKKNDSFFDHIESKNEDTNISEDAKVYEVSDKKHFSYEARVSLMILFTILFFFVACIFIFQAFSYKNVSKINYDEESFANYKTCLANSTKDNCLGEDLDYVASTIGTISTDFRYKASFNKDFHFNYDYYVVGNLSIYDVSDPSKVYYSNEEVLIDKTNIIGDGSFANFSTSINIDYQKYNKFVVDYGKSHNLNVLGTLDVGFYVEDINTARKVSSINMPLNTNNFRINKELINNNNENAVAEECVWSDENSFYATFGVLFSLLGLLMFIRLSNYLYRTLNNTSIYDKKLQQILLDYDKYIVISRGGYAIPSNMRVIKVTEFTELMDARDSLNKPIIYVCINSVKSEFYVEDVDKVYVYVMKKVDFDED